MGAVTITQVKQMEVACRLGLSNRQVPNHVSVAWHVRGKTINLTGTQVHYECESWTH